MKSFAIQRPRRWNDDSLDHELCGSGAGAGAGVKFNNIVLERDSRHDRAIQTLCQAEEIFQNYEANFSVSLRSKEVRRRHTVTDN